MNVDILNQQGEKIGQEELNPQIFGAAVNPNLMAQAARVYLANQRRGTHKTKSRGEVSGGGRKPWPQKNTGRARHGSIRSPIWVGGGHAKSKRPVRHGLKLPRKMRRRALLSALTAQFRDGNVLVVDKIDLGEISTRKAQAIVDNLVSQEKVLLVIPQKDQVLVKSFRNLESVDIREARQLNAYQVLNYGKILILRESLRVLEETFLL